MLPKIEEKFHEEAKIQDFCASLHLAQEDENKTKFEVRSVEHIDGDGGLAHRKQKLGGTTNSSKHNSTAAKRFKDGFSKAQMYGVLTRKTKNRKNAKESQQNKLIDLTKLDDAKQVANNLIQDLRNYDADKIQTHLNKFENADLTFPKLWNKEKLFQNANRIAYDESRIARGSKSARSITSTGNTKKQHGGQFQKRETNFYERAEDLVGGQQFFSGCVFYSEPVSLKRERRINSGKLLPLRTCHSLPSRTLSVISLSD